LKNIASRGHFNPLKLAIAEEIVDGKQQKIESDFKARARAAALGH